MAEKLKLDLSLVLPDVADERDACMGRVHVVRVPVANIDLTGTAGAVPLGLWLGYC